MKVKEIKRFLDEVRMVTYSIVLYESGVAVLNGKAYSSYASARMAMRKMSGMIKTIK